MSKENYFFFRVEDPDPDVMNAFDLDLVGKVMLVQRGTGRSTKDVWGIIKAPVETEAELRAVMVNCVTRIDYLQRVETLLEGKALSRQTAFW